MTQAHTKQTKLYFCTVVNKWESPSLSFVGGCNKSDSVDYWKINHHVSLCPDDHSSNKHNEYNNNNFNPRNGGHHTSSHMCQCCYNTNRRAPSLWWMGYCYSLCMEEFPLLNICWLVGGCLVGCGMKLQHPFVAAAALVLLRWTKQTFSKYIHPSIALLCTIILWYDERRWEGGWAHKTRVHKIETCCSTNAFVFGCSSSGWEHVNCTVRHVLFCGVVSRTGI